MKIKQKKGISLIVLVITIIIMIILASTIIISLNNSGVINKANKAKKDADEATLRESANIAYMEYLLAKNTGEKITQTVEEYVKEKMKEQGFTEEQLKLVEITDNGDVYIYTKEPVIPEGFVASIYKGETKISEGLVIYETTSLNGITQTTAMETYNQYVWIPVDDISEFIRRDGYSSGNLQVSVSSGKATEPSSYDVSTSSPYAEEVSDYNKMKASVEKYGGFYIARYEAGDGTATSKRTGYTPAKTVVSKKNAHVYNYMLWGESMSSIAPFTKDDVENVAGAVYLSKNIYPENGDYEVVSTLVYGVQWDAIMNFVADVENPYVVGKKYIEDSTNMGWYYNNYSRNPEHKTGIDVDDNSSNKVKNVYDLAGNVKEWTMEAYYALYRIIRGGSYGTISNAPASSRDQSYPHNITSGSEKQHGFRVALYLK